MIALDWQLYIANCLHGLQTVELWQVLASNIRLKLKKDSLMKGKVLLEHQLRSGIRYACLLLSVGKWIDKMKHKMADLFLQNQIFTVDSS